MHYKVPISIRAFLGAFLAGALVLALITRAAGPDDKNGPPAKYDAMTDLDERPLPPLPKLGPAGFVFKDPTFGTRILRLTDEKTYEGHACMTPAAAEQNTFNTDSTRLMAHAAGGWGLLYSFDKATMQAQRLMDPKNSKQPLVLDMRDLSFSYTDPDILYGTSTKGHKLMEYNIAKNTYLELFDLDKAVGGDAVRVGMVSPSKNGILAVNFGGKQQNEDPYELVFDPQTKTSHLLNTEASTLDGKPLKIKLGQKMHNSHIDLSGRYVLCTSSPASHASMKVAVWDIQAGDVYAANVFRDHRANGFGMAISKTGLTMLSPDGVKNPKPFCPSMDKTAIAQGFDRHWSWNNEREGALLPVLVSNYAQEGKNSPNKLLLGEIDAVSTDGSNTIYRFAHHRSTYVDGFWDTPRGNVSQDGKYFMFTSNWEQTVGKGRQDVFIVELSRKPFQ